MIKHFALISALALFAGCTGGKGDTGETGDTNDTDTGTGPAAWDLVDFSGDCAGGLCIYTMTTSRSAGLLELWITETADDVSPTPWSETHDGFALVETLGDGSEKYELRLDWVTTTGAQVANETTLLNPDVVDMTGLTWSFEASSPEGDYDCVVTGHDPAYFESRCTNVE